MSYNVCIHQSLRKRIVDEVDDAMKRFINHFDQLLCDLDETQRLFQLDDCQILMEKGDEEPYCQLYRDLFRTLNCHLNDVWSKLKLATTTLCPLREKSILKKQPSSHEETNHPSLSVPVEAHEVPRELEVTNDILPVTEKEYISTYAYNTYGVTGIDRTSVQGSENDATCEKFVSKRDLNKTNAPESKKIKI